MKNENENPIPNAQPQESSVAGFNSLSFFSKIEIQLYKALEEYMIDPEAFEVSPDVNMALDMIGLSFNADGGIDVNKTAKEVNMQQIFGRNKYKSFSDKGFIKTCLPMALLNMQGESIAYVQLLQNLGLDSFVGDSIEELLEKCMFEDDMDKMIIQHKKEVRRLDPTILYEIDCRSTCRVSKFCPFIKTDIIKKELPGRPCIFFLSNCLRNYVFNKSKYTTYFINVEAANSLNFFDLDELSKKIAILQSENDIIMASRSLGGVEISEEFTKLGSITKTESDPSNAVYASNNNQIEALEKRYGISHAKLADHRMKKELMHMQHSMKTTTPLKGNLFKIESSPSPLVSNELDHLLLESVSDPVSTIEQKQDDFEVCDENELMPSK